jgi:hypothetical protein
MILKIAKVGGVTLTDFRRQPTANDDWWSRKGRLIRTVQQTQEDASIIHNGD